MIKQNNIKRRRKKRKKFSRKTPNKVKANNRRKISDLEKKVKD